MSRSPTFRRLQRLVAEARRRAGIAPRADGPSRRDVLGALTGALALGALPTVQGCGAPGLRVAVVGAGLAGTHAALRLHEAGVGVVLYEASDRLGGRTFTGRDLFANGHLCELGGELVDSNHATLFALADELGLTLDDRQGGELAALNPEVFWVQGAAVTDETLLEQLAEVVADIEADYDAAETDDDAFTALDEETLAAWLDRRVPRASYEALHVVLDVAYRGEFGLETAEQSALNLVYLIGLDTETWRVFGDSDERYHTHEGNDAFVTRMAERLPADAVRTGHRLVAASGEGPYRITLETASGTVEDVVDHLVLAVPFTTLRDVDLAGLPLSDDKRTIVSELGYGTNTKIMGEFARPVWREDHDASGAITGDLPLQQTWDSSLGQTGDGAVLTNFLGGEAGVEAGDGEAEAWFTGQVLTGLDDVFPASSDAYVAGSAVRMHWPTVPTARGSYTCYRPGQWSFWPREGDREGNVHFCGEHASADFQGWMEGAAESGLRVTTEILDDHGLSPGAGARRLVALRRALPPLGDGGARTLRALRERRVVHAVAARWVRGGLR